MIKRHCFLGAGVSTSVGSRTSIVTSIVSHSKVLFLVLLLVAFLAPLEGLTRGLNKEIGIDIWNKSTLWAMDAKRTSDRLGMTASKDVFTKIYKHEHTAMKGKLYQVVIIADSKGKVKELKLEFAFQDQVEDEVKTGENKDLYVDANGEVKKERYLEFQMEVGRIHGEYMETAYDGINSALTKRFGKPKSEEGTKTWKYGVHQIALSKIKQAVLLRVKNPIAVAKAERSTSRVSARSLKKNVSRKGADVYLKNIPQIQQGPRGYCLPASTEKYTRYLGLQFDQSDFADMGDTTSGGTVMESFAPKLAKLLSGKGFEVKPVRGNMGDLKTIKKYIDNGLPLIWGMDSLYLREWVSRTQNRKSRLKDKIKRNLEAENNFEEKRRRGHALLIVGYNSSAKEICLSDTTELGAGVERIWIKTEDAALMDSTTTPLLAIVPDKNSKGSSSSKGNSGGSPSTGGSGNKRFY